MQDEVRLLVRAPDRIAVALGRLRIGSLDHIVGDVTDPAAGIDNAEIIDTVHARRAPIRVSTSLTP